MRRRFLLSALCFPVLTVVFLSFSDPALARDGNAEATELDRIVYAVDGAESSHGRDASMWRARSDGPQGPMQVSESAAVDVGGGNRFDIAQNRAIGRAYLGLLYRRYGNWTDAVSAYNWGMGNLDRWITGGRQSERLVPAVAVYLQRVLRDSGTCRQENCQAQMVRIEKKSHQFGQRSATSHINNLFLPGMEQSGRPLPRLVDSGRPWPGMEQCGRPLPSLRRSGPIRQRRLS
jgi:hypothetical protein